MPGTLDATVMADGKENIVGLLGYRLHSFNRPSLVPVITIWQFQECSFHLLYFLFVTSLVAIFKYRGQRYDVDVEELDHTHHYCTRSSRNDFSIASTPNEYQCSTFNRTLATYDDHVQSCSDTLERASCFVASDSVPRSDPQYFNSGKAPSHLPLCFPCGYVCLHD